METITITRDEFADAVKKANDKFRKIGSKNDTKNEMAEMMMGLQNIMFGSLLGTVLFDGD